MEAKEESCRNSTSPHYLTRLTCPRCHPYRLHMNIANLSPAQLRRAANIKEQIDKLQKELGTILSFSPAAAPAKGPKKMSASARARISAAAKARWAKVKGTAKPAAEPKKKMSAAAKAKLSALARARWAKAKKAGKTRL